MFELVWFVSLFMTAGQFRCGSVSSLVQVYISKTLNCGVFYPINELDLFVGKMRVVSFFSAIDGESRRPL